jgi:hypothetical protein
MADKGEGTLRFTSFHSPAYEIIVVWGDLALPYAKLDPSHLSSIDIMQEVIYLLRARARLLSRLPIIISAITIHNLPLAHAQPFVWLIQSEDIDAGKVDDSSFVLSTLTHMHSISLGEIFVYVFRVELVVRQLFEGMQWSRA